MDKQQQFDASNYIPPILEKTVLVSSTEYYQLLITKGKYEELKVITDRMFSLLTPNEMKDILKSVRLYRRDKHNKL